MASSLISDECGSAAEANSLFATEKGLLVLRPGKGCCSSFHFTIPSGCYALVARHGADYDYYDRSTGRYSAVWPAGLHFPFPPWTGVSNLVTKQSVVLDLPVKACKTKDNVTVNVYVGLVFRIMGDESLGEDPELVRKFVHQVKPRGLEQQLRDAQDEAVRALARSMKHTEIYGIRSGSRERMDHLQRQHSQHHSAQEQWLPEDEEQEEEEEEEVINVGESALPEAARDEILEGSADKRDRQAAQKAISKGENVAAEMRARLNRQFEPQGVQIQSVMIKSVTLPDDIQEQMTDKTMAISQKAQQQMYHEDAMQHTRMENEVQMLLQTQQELQEQERTAGAEILNSEKVKLNDAIAQAFKAEANIREETKVRIENTMAENALQVQRVIDRMNENKAKAKVQAEKDAAELLANTKFETQTKLSEADLHAARKIADAHTVRAKAEGQIAPWLEKKKEFQTHQRQMKVYDQLSNNPGLVIMGKSDNGVDSNLVAVADAILQDNDGNGNSDSARAKLMAELALLGTASSAATAFGNGHHGNIPAMNGNHIIKT